MKQERVLGERERDLWERVRGLGERERGLEERERGLGAKQGGTHRAESESEWDLRQRGQVPVDGVGN